MSSTTHAVGIRVRLLVFALFLCTLSMFQLTPVVDAQEGFQLIASDNGVELYRKDYQNGEPDFVQVVHLDQQASVRLLHGTIASPGTGSGQWGGPHPTFWKQSLSEVWQNLATNGQAFCVTNGQFFGTDFNPTGLSFPLKVDYGIVSEGNDTGYVNQRLMLEIWPNRSKISPLSSDSFYQSSAPNIIAGLSEYADKGPNNFTGRTFIGVKDANSDGTYRTILIFNSKGATQADAAKVLRDFGASDVMMFDGGDSTQLTCKGQPYVSSSRRLPQTIATFGASVGGCPTISDWRGQYWNNKGLSGNPVLCRNDGSVDFNWGGGSPDPSKVPSDGFSARWTRSWNFEASNYRFHLRGDDGLRLYLDNNLVIDQWKDQGRTEYTVDVYMNAGAHELKVEYYENGGDANVALWWDKLNDSNNYALNRSSWASSEESGSYSARFGNDGSTTSRWSSRISSSLGREWWRVDLGSEKTINRVIIRWEQAYAARYFVGTNTDGGNEFSGGWYDLSSPTVRIHNLNARNARHVAVIMDVRAPTMNNYSFYEVEVYYTTLSQGEVETIVPEVEVTLEE